MKELDERRAFFVPPFSHRAADSGRKQALPRAERHPQERKELLRVLRLRRRRAQQVPVSPWTCLQRGKLG